MRIALYEPDIPQNTGTILRLCACLAIEAHIIEPSGFPVTDRAFRRAGMDYIDNVSIARHGSFAAFEEWLRRERLQLVLMTTAADRSYLDHTFTADQVLLFGREAGRRPPAHPDAVRYALTQYCRGGGNGRRRGLAANAGFCAVIGLS
jgi:tRNA (cytidine/uridine-2'-O-)-methyltransferase